MVQGQIWKCAVTKQKNKKTSAGFPALPLFFTVHHPGGTCLELWSRTQMIRFSPKGEKPEVVARVSCCVEDENEQECSRKEDSGSLPDSNACFVTCFQSHTPTLQSLLPVFSFPVLSTLYVCVLSTRNLVRGRNVSANRQDSSRSDATVACCQSGPDLRLHRTRLKGPNARGRSRSRPGPRIPVQDSLTHVFTST